MLNSWYRNKHPIVCSSCSRKSKHPLSSPDLKHLRLANRTWLLFSYEIKYSVSVSFSQQRGGPKHSVQKLYFIYNCYYETYGLRTGIWTCSERSICWIADNKLPSYAFLTSSKPIHACAFVRLNEICIIDLWKSATANEHASYDFGDCGLG